MEIKELRELLAESSQSSRGRYVPWWEGDFDNFVYKYEVFSAEEIRNMADCAEKCKREDLETAAGGYGLTLFQLLVWHNLYRAVEKILEDGRADVDGKDCGGKGITPLLLACCCGNRAMAQLLIAHGANPSLCDAVGNNGFHYLAGARVEGLALPIHCQENSIEQRAGMAELLTADINGKNAEGLTPLELLLSRNNANYSCALTGVFLERGAATDFRDENGNTLLLTAIGNHHITAALHLMKQGDMIRQENKEGVSPIQLARNHCNDGLCILLQDHGASLPDGSSIRVDVGNLSRITGNAFIDRSSGKQDNLALALALAEKLIRQLDPDDDDDIKYLLNILNNALLEDESCRILEVCRAGGIDFTAPIHSGGSVTCLRDICLNGNSGVKAIRKLTELGVDMESAVIQGKTPVNIIASRPDRTMLFGKKDDYFENAARFFSKESMEQVDNTGTTALHGAARYNHVEMLKVMIDKGADVNLTEDAPAEPGNTPLHTACIYGNAEAARLLLASGADDRLQNINGEAPAHLAVMQKKYGGDLTAKQRADLLRELKTLDIATNDGKTPLMLLQSLDINACLELLPIFLERGVDVNRRDSQGNTALILNTSTLNRCFKDVAKELIRAGADVNAANDQGNTALHYALRYGSQETARFLVKKGADYNLANLQGVTPVQIAVEKGYDTVLELMTDIR